MENTSKILIAALAGAATGALVALLFAPDSGDELRNRIREGARRLSDDLRNQIQDGFNVLNRTKEDAQNFAEDAINKTKKTTV